MPGCPVRQGRGARLGDGGLSSIDPTPASDDSRPPHLVLETLVREQRARLVGALARWCGDIQLAEDGFAGLAVSDWPALQDDPGMHPGAAFTWLEEVV